ncbi:sugar phosphorylase [Desulfogranum mediterraneum]|uniref:sugar phosphorylase n=1 Tax=Desulfogranum mediterraneum TaxID=160661 RepID=UPI00042257B6|nr:sugar phosphorylase [Desulfogranum mediterraneum]
MWRLTHSFKQALLPRLTTLYGAAQVDRLLERIALIAGRYNYLEQRCSLDHPCWDERTAILITYGDMITRPGEPGLVTLGRFLGDFLKGLLPVVHILPFFPSSSDDGFAVIDYRRVDPEIGSWDDLESLAQQYRLMFDLVLNHVSSRSQWFEDFRGAVAPARNYFLEMDPATELSQVVRPRSSPLLTEVMTVKGKKHLWTTFSDDQLDLNYANPDVLLEMLDILLGYINKGAAILRLDAVAYLWKEVGSPCINLAQTHELVKLLRDVVDHVTPGTLLLTETNLPHGENVSYFGAGDEAHLVYQFSLPPLLLHALHSGSARHLAAWARSLSPPPPGCAYVNFTASHDGIGVRPLEGIVAGEELTQLVETIRRCNGFVSCRSDSQGREQPYELNITYFDALKDLSHPDDLQRQVLRFLCSQTVMLGLQGIPAIYFHSLTASPNNQQGVLESGRYRSVNRGRWSDEELRLELADPATVTARVFREYQALLEIRAGLAAFHPDAEQVVLECAEELLVFYRRPAEQPSILCIHNLAGCSLSLDLRTLAGVPEGVDAWMDHISAAVCSPELQLQPYQSLWLEACSPESGG